MVKFLIIGAGPTGLGAAWRLQELGETDFLILEAGSAPGGLAGSQVGEGGFIWDSGVHVLHSHYPYFDEVVKKSMCPMLTHKRNAQAWMRNKWVPYPVQYYLHLFPPSEAQRCLLNMYERDRLLMGNHPYLGDNFKGNLAYYFGEEMCKSFLYPYNEKIWATPLDQINTSWLGQRVPKVDFKLVLTNLLNGDHCTSDWGPNADFIYPEYGGAGSLWKCVANCLMQGRISYNERVIQCHLGNPEYSPRQFVTTNDGYAIEYEHLIMTAPLDWFCSVSLPVGDFGTKPLNLRHTTTHIVGLGMKGSPPEGLADKNWVYFPEPQFPFYRGTVLSTMSPNLCPPDHWSFMMEIAESDWTDNTRFQGDNDMVEACIQALEDADLLVHQHITHTDYSRKKYGYPVPTLERDDELRRVIPYLESKNVYPRGRFGFWKYEVSNQDHCFMQGKEVIDRIVNNTEETVARL